MEENEIQYGKITAAGETGRRGREQEMKENGVIQEYTGSLSRQIREEYHISEEYYHGEIKRGLRNSDGTGVMVGVTKVGSVQGYLLQDGQRIPIPGRLYYRGIELNDICLLYTSPRPLPVGQAQVVVLRVQFHKG